MALLAWYKLDGNALDSSGHNWNGTASNMSWGSGKIGQCGVFNGSSSRININLEYPKNWGDPFSVSSWVYVPSSAVWSNNYFSNIVSRAYYTGSHGLAKSTTNNRVSFYIRTDSGTYNAYGYIERDRWHHISGVWDGKTGVLYIDGVAVSSISPAISGVPVNYPWDIGGARAFGGSTGSWFDGMIDDVRIYDHALSPKEIKELAKAKILHYKFDDFQEPTENLLLNTSEPITSSSYGIKDYPLKTPLVEGRTYTVSMKATLGEGKTYFGLYNSGGSVSVTSLNTNHLGDDGIYRRTFTWRVGTSSNTYLRVYHMPSSTVVESTIEWIQIEEKPYSTEYTPDVRAGTVHDCSGYDNHAELALATTPRWVGSESSKIGSGVYEFDNTNDMIVTPMDHLDTFTVSLWLKRKGSLGTRQFMWTGWNGFSCEITTGNLPQFSVYTGSQINAIGSTALALDRWYHFVGVFESGVGLKLYIDGKLVKTTTTTGTMAYNKTVAHVGNYSSYYFDGYIDDVRRYATALSDEDILELYQTRGSLDNHGNLYASEIMDLDSKILSNGGHVWDFRYGLTSISGLKPLGVE